jgi:hypothetical protein
MPYIGSVNGVATNNGSAREFEETGNWRRLERFVFPGTSGAVTEALSRRSEIRNYGARGLRGAADSD